MRRSDVIGLTRASLSLTVAWEFTTYMHTSTIVVPCVHVRLEHDEESY